MGIKKLLGKRIAEIRKSLNLSQENFAEKIGMSRNSLSLIERGINLPAGENIDKIHNCFNISYSELFNFNEKSNSKTTEIISKIKMIKEDNLYLIEALINALISEN